MEELVLNRPRDCLPQNQHVCAPQALRQNLYLCTSKAGKLSTSAASTQALVEQPLLVQMSKHNA
jgi:hypothetical protein